MNNNKTILEIKNLNKFYGLNHVLKDVSFSMNKGEVIAIIGSSGGGKSTLLRCLTFLERIQSGEITIAGDDIIKQEMQAVSSSIKLIFKHRVEGGKKLKFFVSQEIEGKHKTFFCKKVDVPFSNKYKFFYKHKPKDEQGNVIKERLTSVYPKDKVLREKALKMGLVFQDFNLFPHKTVTENLIMAPMLVKGLDRESAIELAKLQLEKVGLSDKANAYPCNISGGQKQRVAIARALCMSPEILCFDEPTSALDPELTGEVLKVISSLRDSNTTMLIVTHEIMFAREVADKVVFLDGGVILEMGDAKSVIDNPQKPRTKEFMDKILKG